MRILIVGPDYASDDLAKAFEWNLVDIYKKERSEHIVDRVFGETGLHELESYLLGPSLPSVDAVVFFSNTLSEIKAGLPMLRKSFSGPILLISPRNWSLGKEAVNHWGATDWCVDLEYAHQGKKMKRLVELLVFNREKVNKPTPKEPPRPMNNDEVALFTKILSQTSAGNRWQGVPQMPKKSLPTTIHVFSSPTNFHGHLIEFTKKQQAVLEAITESALPVSQEKIQERSGLSLVRHVREYVRQIRIILHQTEPGLEKTIQLVGYGKGYQYTPPR